MQEYLKFGVVTASTEEAMKDGVPNRAAAAEIANMSLHNYATETARLAPGKTAYLALIVRMPEDVDNDVKDKPSKFGFVNSFRKRNEEKSREYAEYKLDKMKSKASAKSAKKNKRYKK